MPRPVSVDKYLRLRKRLLAAQWSFRSGSKMASVMGLPSKCQAQHFALGRVPVTPVLRAMHRQHLEFQVANRILGKLAEKRAS